MSRLRRPASRAVGPPDDRPARHPTRSPELRVWFWLAAVVLCVSLLFHGGHVGSSDGMSMYQVARSIVEDGDVAIVLGVVWEGADGRYYSPFGIGLSLVAVPVYAVVRLVRVAVPVPEDVSQGVTSLLSPLILSLMAVAVHRLARRLGAGVRMSVLVGLGAALGTFAVIYGKAFWSEPLAALLLTVALERTLAGAPIAAGAAAAGAALTRPQLFLFAPLLLWAQWREGGPSRAGTAVGPLAIAGIIQVGYNLIRWGDALNFGYSGTEVPQGFTTPVFAGLRGLLFHPEKSVLLFAPVVVLVPVGLAELWRRGGRVAFWMIVGNLGIAFVLSATWWDWGGGFTWGPRLLIPGVVPAVAVVALWGERSSRRRLAVVVAFTVGALVSLPSLVVGGGAQLADDPRPEEGPKILRQYELAPDTVAYTFDHLYEEPAGRDANRTLDLWQFGLAWRLGRVGLAASLFMSCLIALGAVVAIRRLREVGSANGSREEGSGWTKER